MGMSKAERIAALLGSLKKENKFDQIANVIDKVSIKESDQIREIVPIEEWINSEYYCGADVKKLYPFWKDLICDIFRDGKQNYNQIVLTGGLGTGKSTCGLYIVLRKLYELSCYKNVAGLFGLMSNTMTAFLYFSLTKYQAERSGFAQLRLIIDGIPYFKELFQRNKYRNSTLDFPENIRVFYGSSTADMIGMNVISAIIDEANFFGDSSGSEVDLGSVEELYNKIQ